MNILVVYRLMSAFEGALALGRWEPAGAPAAARLIEALDRSPHGLDLVLYPSLRGRRRVWSDSVRPEGLAATIRVPAFRVIGLLPTRLSGFLYPIVLGVYSLLCAWKCRPDVFYTDRGNILGAALVARLTAVPVVVRLLGVASKPSLFDQNARRSLSAAIERWAFRAPIALALCSRDGSDARRFLTMALRPDVPRIIRLNGLIRGPRATPRVHGMPLRVVLLSRLEPGKGLEALFDVLIGADAGLLSKITLTIVGGGTLEEPLRRKVAEAGVDKTIRFQGSTPHSKVPALLAENDVYISLNEIAQITNSNLEAAGAGLCLLLSDTCIGDDADARSLFDSDAAIWIRRDELGPALQRHLSRLCDDSKELERRKAASARVSESIGTWDDRIDWELRLLEALAARSFEPSRWGAWQVA